MKRLMAAIATVFVAFGLVLGVQPVSGQPDNTELSERWSSEDLLAGLELEKTVDLDRSNLGTGAVFPGDEPEVFTRFEQPEFQIGRITLDEPLSTLTDPLNLGQLEISTLTIRNPMSVEYASTSGVSDGVLITSSEDLWSCGSDEYLEWAIAENVPGLPPFFPGQVPPFLESFTGVTSSICSGGVSESFFAQGPEQFANPILTIGITAENLYGIAFFSPRPADISVIVSGSRLDDPDGAWFYRTETIPSPDEFTSLDELDALLATPEGAEALVRLTTPPTETAPPPPVDDEVPPPTEDEVPPVEDPPAVDPVQQPAATDTEKVAGSEPTPTEGDEGGGVGGTNPVIILVPVVVGTGAIVGYWVYRRKGGEPEFVTEPPKRAVKADRGDRQPYEFGQLLVGEAEREDAPSNGEGWLAPSGGAYYNTRPTLWADPNREALRELAGEWSGVFVNSTTGEVLSKRDDKRWQALQQEFGLQAPPTLLELMGLEKPTAAVQLQPASQALRQALDVTAAQPGAAPGDGQFGLAVRYFEPRPGDSEFGFYWTQLHNRLPILSAEADREVGLAAGDYAGTAQYFRELPEGLDTLGTSFDRPLQVDEVELLFSALTPLDYPDSGSYPFLAVPVEPGSAFVGMPDRIYHTADLAAMDLQPDGSWLFGAARDHLLVPTGFAYAPDGGLHDPYEVMGSLQAARFDPAGQARVETSGGSGVITITVFDVIPSQAEATMNASSYARFFGADALDQRNDRDFVSLTASYSF
jgi:hypothetical protein